MVGRSPREPGNGSSPSDEEWQAFLQESESGAAASAPKEPSARARMVTERLRHQGEPDGWRTGPAWRERDGRAGRRRKTWAVLGGRLLLLQYDQELANSACEVYDGFMHPQFTTSAPTGAAPTGPTEDPYDRSEGVERDDSEGCGTVSRV
ncbi:hypothetical protein [Streptomyces sp. NPDC006527]|uniref:hypothetical protein n=1 Tax=Streptomyces sp. NPDC006527 TaxID=3364749 RepID=UPI0036C80A14